MSRKLKVAGATLNQTPIDWVNNSNNILASIRLAISKNIEVLSFQELTITGYGCEDLFLSKWVAEKSFDTLVSIIPECKNITVCIGLPVQHNNKVYNCVAVVKNQKLLGITAKQNLPLDGVHYEHRWFNAWPRNTVENFLKNDIKCEIGDIIYTINDVNIGFEICEDAWVDDRPACRLIERKVELIINPSASHFAFNKTKRRKQLIIDSSDTFNCAYLYVNALGNEAGKLIYDGEIILAKKGKLISYNSLLSMESQNILDFDLEFDTTTEKELAIKVDSKNEEFGKAESLALFDYLRKSKSRGFVLSLSGGADSATCAVLVAEMIKNGINTLGISEFLNKIGRSDIEIQDNRNSIEIKKKVTKALLTCAYQGTKNSSSITFNAAKTLAESIGATFHHWTIDDVVTSYTSTISSAIGRELKWDKDDIALQNIQARSRSPIIWMMANLENKLLLTTSNRSEGDVGYATMDGDTSGSLAPIAGVDKPFIRSWLNWAEKELGYTGLNLVNRQVPTAELRPADKTQTDEDDLMPYPILVEIEKLAIGEHKSPKEVYDKLSVMQLTSTNVLKEYINKFFRLWSYNQWKRERLAPSFHLDDFNIDPKTWCRFPILSGSFEEELRDL